MRPKWMLQYVTVPITDESMAAGKKPKQQELKIRSDFERMQETDFIKSMRASVVKQPALVDRMEGANRVPLVPRPGKEFYLQIDRKFLPKD
jgi:hypothetical protein